MHDGMHALRTLIVCVLAKVSGMACHGLKSVNYFPTACGRMEASGTASSASTPKTPPYISSVDQSVNPPPPTPRWPDGGIWNGTLGLYPQDPAIYGNLAGRPILPGCEPPVCLPTYYVSNGMGAIHAQVEVVRGSCQHGVNHCQCVSPPTTSAMSGMGAIHAQVSQGRGSCRCRPSVMMILPAIGVSPSHATHPPHNH